VTYLLRLGVDPASRGTDGTSAAQVARREGHRAVAELIESWPVGTAEAPAVDHDRAARSLQEFGPLFEDSVAAALRNRQVPLLRAVQEGDASSVRTLLDAGGDPNAACPGGTASLMLAIQRSDVEIMRLLLEHGADADRREGESTPLIAAIVRNVLSHRANNEIVRLVLAETTDVNARAADGSTALIEAVRFRRVWVVRELLARGAVVHVRNAAGETALDLARRNRDSGIVRLLQRADKAPGSCATVASRGAGKQP
jgi:ankyrin repeat protein